MARTIHDVLVALGARPVRDGHLAFDVSRLGIDSIFGGPLDGEAAIEVSSPEAFAFTRPAELALCGTLWLPGVQTPSQLAEAVIDAHNTIRSRLEDDSEALRRLGLKPRLVAPDPRATAAMAAGSHKVTVAIDDNGDLVIDTLDGRVVPAEHARVMSVEDAVDGGALARVSALAQRLSASGVLASAEGFDVDVDISEDGEASTESTDDATGALPGVPPRAGWSEDEDVATVTIQRSGLKGGLKTEATRHLSDEQMQELAAALNDEDDDDEIDARDEFDVVDPAGDEDENATLSVPAMKRAEARPPRDTTTAVPDPTGSQAPVAMRKDSSLLDALGDDDEAAPAEGPGDGIEDESEDDVEPTRTAARIPDASDPEEQAALDGLRELDDEEDPTVSALGLGARGQAHPSDSGAAMPPPRPALRDDEPTGAVDTQQVVPTARAPLAPQATASAPSDLRVDDFPALPDQSEDNDPAPTSVVSPAAPAPSEFLSSPPTLAVARGGRTSDDDVEREAAGFDDGEGKRSAPARARGPRTIENAKPATAALRTKATVSQPEEPVHAAFSMGGSDEGTATAVNTGKPPPADDGASLADLLDDDEAPPAPAPPASPAPAVQAEAPAAHELAAFDDDEEEIKTRAVMVGAALQQARARRTTDEERDVDADALEARAQALEEEARALRERAQQLRAARRAAAVASEAMSSSPSSFPLMASMEVEEVVLSSEPSSAPVRQPDSALADDSSHDVRITDEPAPAPDVDDAESVQPDLHVDVIPEPRGEPRAAAGTLTVAAEGRPDPLDDDEGVSLAEVQAALGAIPGEATQVGALEGMGLSELKSFSGDSGVFETGDKGIRPRRPPVLQEAPLTRVHHVDAAPPAAPSMAASSSGSVAGGLAEAMDDEPLSGEIRVPSMEEAAESGSQSIGLVVEDAKARDRLKKHLSPRFKRLVEAETASAAASLPDVADLDAIVFVRPRPDDATREGIAQLSESLHAPRILVISSDARFDEMPQVSLRLPLGQRASEVAQQVLDGLRELGVEAIEASAEGG